MKSDDLQQLLYETKQALAANQNARFAIVGITPVTYDIVAFFRAVNAEPRLLGAYDKSIMAKSENGFKPIEHLLTDQPDFVIIASDAEKESLLEAAVPFLTSKTNVILAGYGHFAFRDALFDEISFNSLVPSLANGYPNTLIHLYQCLRNAAGLGLKGVVAEFGMFKGGTTKLLAQFVNRLGQSWPVIGFDTFAGFPPRRSVLDMYAHPGCVFLDEAGVRRYVESENIEVIPGDIVQTASRLKQEDIVLAFIDTDNYTSASAILEIIQERVVAGGAIVFDHFTGRNRFVYTLGERIAAKRLLGDRRYFQLHDTGVFYKQR